VHKAGPRYSATHPPFSIKFILWGANSLVKPLHDSIPLYSYAKDPDQVNCQYFSAAPPSTPTSLSAIPFHTSLLSQPELSFSSAPNSSSPVSSSPLPSPPSTFSAENYNISKAPPSSSSSSSPLIFLSTVLSSTASSPSISIPMDSFKSLVTYIQKLERQIELQQQQLEVNKQQEEVQHKVITGLAKDLKFKTFQCELLEEKVQQLLATTRQPCDEADISCTSNNNAEEETDGVQTEEEVRDFLSQMKKKQRPDPEQSTQGGTPKRKKGLLEDI